MKLTHLKLFSPPSLPRPPPPYQAELGTPTLEPHPSLTFSWPQETTKKL